MLTNTEKLCDIYEISALRSALANFKYCQMEALSHEAIHHVLMTVVVILFSIKAPLQETMLEELEMCFPWLSSCQQA